MELPDLSILPDRFTKFQVDHTHKGDSDCLGNPTIFSESQIEYLKTRVYNWEDLDDDGSFKCEFEDRYIVGSRVHEDENSMLDVERLVWVPTHLTYTQTIEPKWDNIPDRVKESPEAMASLDRVNNIEITGEEVQAFVGTLTVINVFETAGGIVTGFDIATQSQYTFTP